MIASLKMLLKYNLIKNCDVSIQEVEIAERIFGPDIAALKGKSVRRNPNQVLDDWIEIPEELREIYYDLVLCVDLMFVNGIPFLTAIDRTIRYRSVVPLENRTKEQLYKALDVVLRMYNEAGYRIREIHADNEFRPLFETVADDLDVIMNYTNAGDKCSSSWYVKK